MDNINYIGQWYVDGDENVSMSEIVDTYVTVMDRPEEFDFSLEDIRKRILDLGFSTIDLEIQSLIVIQNRHEMFNL